MQWTEGVILTRSFVMGSGSKLSISFEVLFFTTLAVWYLCVNDDFFHVPHSQLMQLPHIGAGAMIGDDMDWETLAYWGPFRMILPPLGGRGREGAGSCCPRFVIFQ